MSVEGVCVCVKMLLSGTKKITGVLTVIGHITAATIIASLWA